MAHSTSSKKDLGVVTPLVTAEKDQASFFCQEDSFLVYASPIFLSWASERFRIFCIYFQFNFVLFSFYSSLLIPRGVFE